MRAIDLHVHLPLPAWVEGSLGPYREPAERYFRSQIELQTAEELAAAYEAIDCVGVLFGSDAPFFAADTVLKEWEQRLTPAAFRRVARDNAARLLGLAG